MFMIHDDELLGFIRSDLAPYDLTTSLIKKEANASLEIFTREDITISCIEEVASIARLLHLSCECFYKSGDLAPKNAVLARLSGSFLDLHKAYKLCQVLLEYACGSATYTAKMLKAIKEVNPKCSLLATRKSFPFAKNFCLKAVLSGGAKIHRLGLQDSVLFFAQHRCIYENQQEFYKKIQNFKEELVEKKIVVESCDLVDAKELLKAGVDVLQCDKMSIMQLEELVAFKNSSFKSTMILAAGGINAANAASFAKSGVNAIVSSAMYIKGGMSDISTRMSLVKA